MAYVNGPRLKTGSVGACTLIRRSVKPQEPGPLEERLSHLALNQEIAGSSPARITPERRHTGRRARQRLDRPV